MKILNMKRDKGYQLLDFLGEDPSSFLLFTTVSSFVRGAFIE